MVELREKVEQAVNDLTDMVLAATMSGHGSDAAVWAEALAHASEALASLGDVE